MAPTGPIAVHCEQQQPQGPRDTCSPPSGSIKDSLRSPSGRGFGMGSLESVAEDKTLCFETASPVGWSSARFRASLDTAPPEVAAIRGSLTRSASAEHSFRTSCSPAACDSLAAAASAAGPTGSAAPTYIPHPLGICASQLQPLHPDLLRERWGMGSAGLRSGPEDAALMRSMTSPMERSYASSGQQAAAASPPELACISDSALVNDLTRSSSTSIGASAASPSPVRATSIPQQQQQQQLGERGRRPGAFGSASGQRSGQATALAALVEHMESSAAAASGAGAHPSHLTCRVSPPTSAAAILLRAVTAGGGALDSPAASAASPSSWIANRSHLLRSASAVELYTYPESRVRAGKERGQGAGLSSASGVAAGGSTNDSYEGKVRGGLKLGSQSSLEWCGSRQDLMQMMASAGHVQPNSARTAQCYDEFSSSSLPTRGALSLGAAASGGLAASCNAADAMLLPMPRTCSSSASAPIAIASLLPPSASASAPGAPPSGDLASEGKVRGGLGNLERRVRGGLLLRSPQKGPSSVDLSALVGCASAASLAALANVSFGPESAPAIAAISSECGAGDGHSSTGNNSGPMAAAAAAAAALARQGSLPLQVPRSSYSGTAHHRLSLDSVHGQHVGSAGGCDGAAGDASAAAAVPFRVSPFSSMAAGGLAHSLSGMSVSMARSPCSLSSLPSATLAHLDRSLSAYTAAQDQAAAAARSSLAGALPSRDSQPLNPTQQATSQHHPPNYHAHHHTFDHQHSCPANLLASSSISASNSPSARDPATTMDHTPQATSPASAAAAAAAVAAAVTAAAGGVTASVTAAAADLALAGRDSAGSEADPTLTGRSSATAAHGISMSLTGNAAAGMGGPCSLSRCSSVTSSFQTLERTPSLGMLYKVRPMGSAAALAAGGTGATAIPTGGSLRSREGSGCELLKSHTAPPARGTGSGFMLSPPLSPSAAAAAHNLAAVGSMGAAAAGGGGGGGVPLTAATIAAARSFSGNGSYSYSHGGLSAWLASALNAPPGSSEQLYGTGAGHVSGGGGGGNTGLGNSGLLNTGGSLLLSRDSSRLSLFDLAEEASLYNQLAQTLQAGMRASHRGEGSVSGAGGYQGLQAPHAQQQPQQQAALSSSGNLVGGGVMQDMACRQHSGAPDTLEMVGVLELCEEGEEEGEQEGSEPPSLLALCRLDSPLGDEGEDAQEFLLSAAAMQAAKSCAGSGATASGGSDRAPAQQVA